MSHTSQSSTTEPDSEPIPESETESDKKDNPHLNQSNFREWKAYTIDENTIIVHDVPESSVSCYRISGTTRNPRAAITADRVLYEGKVVDSWYDEDVRRVTFTHCWAGRVGRISVSDWFDNPVLLLEPAEFIPDTDILSRFEEELTE